MELKCLSLILLSIASIHAVATSSPAPSPATFSYNDVNYAPFPSPESQPITLAPSSTPAPSPSSFAPTPDADTVFNTNSPQLDAPVGSPTSDPPSTTSFPSNEKPASNDPPSTTTFDTSLYKRASADPPSTTSFKPTSGDSIPGITGSLFSKRQPFRIPKLASANPSLKKLCSTTDYPALCVASLSPFHLGARVDSTSALEVAIKATSKLAGLAASAAERLAASADEETAAGLATCKDLYGDAADDLTSALDALAARDIGTINSMLSAVVTDSETCEDGFVGVDSPLINYNDKLAKMASNCLAIASSIN